jgi:hypothetical protein
VPGGFLLGARIIGVKNAVRPQRALADGRAGVPENIQRFHTRSGARPVAIAADDETVINFAKTIAIYHVGGAT